MGEQDNKKLSVWSNCSSNDYLYFFVLVTPMV